MNRQLENQSAIQGRQTKRFKAAPTLHYYDELKHLTLEAFEERVDRVSADHKLSDSELEFVKRGRRSIKNRDSARDSRQKKTQMITEMRAKIASLEKELATSYKNYDTLASSLRTKEAKQPSPPEPTHTLPGLILSDFYDQHIEWF